WWFEGPMFLDFLYRKMPFDQDVVKPITPPQFLEMYPHCDVVQPPMCTWGAKGFAEVWLNPSNDWIYPHLEMAAERMVELARYFETPSEVERRGLSQTPREVLLAQSSRWGLPIEPSPPPANDKQRTRRQRARSTR